MPLPLPDPENMTAEDEPLSQEQLDMIQESKQEDWDKPAEGEDDPKKEPDKKPDKPEGEDDGTKPEEEEGDGDKRTPEEIEAEKKETKRLDDKAKELDKTVDEVKEIEKGETVEKDRLKKIADDEEITIEEVIESESKDKQLAERHGGDPVKVARALRKEQSEYGKLKTEVEDLRSYKEKIEVSRTQFQEKQFDAQMEKDRDKIIEIFEKNNPEESTDLSDDAMFERGKARIREVYKEKEKAALDEQSDTAKERRKELIKVVSKDYKEFLPKIKELLSEVGDRQINDKEFDVLWLANVARGEKYTPEHIKSLEDQAYKRGVEQPQMIPKSKGGKPNADSGRKGGSGKGSSLSNSEKLRAEDIYGRRDGWSKEQMWDEFAKDDKGKDF